jgi:putative endonuclease
LKPMKIKYYYTYALRLINNDIYIGSCGNLKQRLNDHISGRVKTTKNQRPVKLIYFEGCLSKNKAIVREKQLKTGFGRGYIKKRI